MANTTRLTADDLTTTDVPVCEWVDCDKRAAQVVMAPNPYHSTPEPYAVCSTTCGDKVHHNAHAVARSIARWGC